MLLTLSGLCRPAPPNERLQKIGNAPIIKSLEHKRNLIAKNIKKTKEDLKKGGG